MRIKTLVNRVLGIANLRIVNSHWGPRGPFTSLKRLRDIGVRVEQIIDIGAAQGDWTCEVLTVFPSASVLMVEPRSEMRKHLEEYQRTRENIHLWTGALGSESGLVPINIHGDQSSILHSEYDLRRNGIETVELTTLDILVTRLAIKMPQLIKIDTQGYELEILRGGVEILKSVEFVLLEVSFRQIYDQAPLAGEVISFLTGSGFRIYDICTYSQRPRDGELAQADILFASSRSSVFEHEGWE